MPTTVDLEAIIIRLIAAAGANRTISPTDIARAVHAGADWQAVLPTVRRAAIKLALQGEIAIYRKGKLVDPNDFKGVYRLGMPPPA